MMSKQSPAAAVVLTMSLVCSLLSVSGGAQQTPPRNLSWVETVRLEEGVSLGYPLAVAVISETEIAVAEATPVARVQRLRRTEGLWQLAGRATLPAAPMDIVWDGSRLLVALRQPAGLLALEEEDLAVRRVALPQEIVPGRLAVARSGNLLLQDLAGERVLELDRQGKTLREADLPQGVTALSALWSGGFMAAVASEGRVHRFDDRWREEEVWPLPPASSKPAWPTAIAVAPDGETLVLDRHGGRILTFDSNGRLAGLGAREGWDQGRLWFPADLAMLSDELVVVADQGNRRVEIFRRVRG